MQNSWLVVDQSRNGTFINGKQAEHGKPTPLREGDVLRLSLPVEDQPNTVYE